MAATCSPQAATAKPSSGWLTTGGPTSRHARRAIHSETCGTIEKCVARPEAKSKGVVAVSCHARRGLRACHPTAPPALLALFGSITLALLGQPSRAAQSLPDN